MAQRLTTSFVNTNIPGAYPDVTVKSTPVGITSTGDIVIIGEAAGGADFSAETISENFYSPTQLDRVRNKYISGPIVDAMRAITSPSNDANIQGSAGRIFVVKTNSGAQASASVASDTGVYGTLLDKNYGIDGNKYYYQVTQVDEEAGPSIQGTDIAAFGAPLNGAEFTIRGNGDIEVVVTLSATSGDHSDKTLLAAEIDAALPAGFSCEAAASDAIIIKSDDDVNANEKGYGKSFELIDSNAGDLALLGLSEDLYVSSKEPEIQFAVLRQDTNTNESYDIEAEVALKIGYEGSSATITISGGDLTTTVVGGAGANLAITMSEYTTMSDLAAFIDSQAGYSASADAASTNLSPLRLDEVSGVSIASTGSDLEPGRIKKAAYNFALALSQSAVVDFDFTASAGLPADVAGKQFLTGGARGATTGADVVNAIAALRGIKVNFIVPLFSRDASEDIADGATDSSSTYTIDAVNFAVKSHTLEMSTPKLKRNRVAILSKQDTYANVKTHAQMLSSFRTVLCFQPSSQADSSGNVVEKQPWHTASIVAGMQSAGFYKALTNKSPNLPSFRDPDGFDSGDPGDVEDAIDAGLMFLQKESQLPVWVVDQTTYSFDTNFVYNSLQAVYMADVLAVQLSDSLKNFAVGKSLADINAAAVLGHISQRMDEYRRLKIIGASNDAPLGYKNVNISISGPIVFVKLEAKLATQILFIPIELELSQIENSASA